MDIVYNCITRDSSFELIERKGLGHPDTLADRLAEELSIAYSVFTRGEFGAILHHNFDKLAILGGRTEVKFGGGRLVAPIRVIINGRATDIFDGHRIPVRDLLEKTVHIFLSSHFGTLLSQNDIQIIYQVSTSSTPGAIQSSEYSDKNPRNRWFTPRTIDDLPEIKNPFCNDTSVGCHTEPPPLLGNIILDLENRIHKSPINYDSRVGSDIKILGLQHGNSIDLTIAVPLLANKVLSIADFFETLHELKQNLHLNLSTEYDNQRFNIRLNPLDNMKTGDVYLTCTGSCIESGDEGVVGRGNRLGGYIRTNRPYSMEGIAGKNPVYYTGKVYAGAAYELSNFLSEAVDNEVSMYIAGQRGRALTDPWKIVIESSPGTISKLRSISKPILENYFSKISNITEKFLRREIPIC